MSVKAALADDQRRAANNYMPLAGEVSEQKVVLYRRRGLFPWYGTFHGRFEEEAQGVRLGSDARTRAPKLRSCAVSSTAFSGATVHDMQTKQSARLVTRLACASRAP